MDPLHLAYDRRHGAGAGGAADGFVGGKCQIDNKSTLVPRFRLSRSVVGAESGSNICIPNSVAVVNELDAASEGITQSATDARRVRQIEVQAALRSDSLADGCSSTSVGPV